MWGSHWFWQEHRRVGKRQELRGVGWGSRAWREGVFPGEKQREVDLPRHGGGCPEGEAVTEPASESPSHAERAE